MLFAEMAQRQRLAFSGNIQSSGVTLCSFVMLPLRQAEETEACGHH